MQNMNNIKVASLSKTNVMVIAQFAILLAIAAGLPALVHVQAVTGPIVNATLFLAVALLGVQSALVIGLIPSVIALSVGLLPSPLAPMVPFIMLSNAILVITFAQLKEKNFWFAIASASILKFLFLFSTSFLITRLIANKQIAQKAASLLSWPQLVTALAGGIIAYLILKIIKRS